ncbi:hypothetical protein SCA6_019316 [Theobroma cacao]
MDFGFEPPWVGCMPTLNGTLFLKPIDTSGSRNLQFDAKRKNKIILQNEDIQPIVEEEENLQDEEEEEMVVLKENEGSHDDNDLKLEENGDDLERGGGYCIGLPLFESLSLAVKNL